MTNRAYKKWELLGFVDSDITERYINTYLRKSQKLWIHPAFHEIKPSVAKLYEKLRISYEKCIETVEITQLEAFKNPFVHEFGVIARKQIPGGKVIEALNEYVDDIKDEELNPGMEFSLLRKSKVYGKQSVMLGPTSFVNHSDRMHDTPWVENHLRNRLLKSKRYERLRGSHGRLR